VTVAAVALALAVLTVALLGTCLTDRRPAVVRVRVPASGRRQAGR
jgi:hypothetical protein